MQCKNARFEKGLIIFNCPHCNGALDADESLLSMIWERHQGQIPCPVEACQKGMLVPTKEEVVAIMAGAAAPNTAAPSVDASPASEPTTDTTPTDRTETETAVAKVAPGAAPAPKPVVAQKAEPAPAPAKGITVEAGDLEGGDTNPLDIKHGFGEGAPVTLEQESKGGELTIRTIRHSECQKDGKDNFDATVTQFLRSQGEENILSINPVQYSNGEKQAIDFGVIVIYKSGQEE